MFNIGDRVKNRFRQDQNFKFTQFGIVVGFEGNLMKVEIEGRDYDGYLVNFNWCVPSDWILAD
jgi:hypothetical protein